MKSFITLIVAVAFALGGLFAYSHTDSSQEKSNYASEKTEKPSSKKGLIHYNFEFFSP